MIDEKKLIEDLEMYANTLEYQTNDDFHKGFINAIRVIVQRINNHPEVSEWIPVGERLPERNKPVLVHGESKCRSGYITLVGSCDNGCWFIQSSQDTLSFPCLEYQVIAWMPLPETYKAGGTNV